MAVPDHDERWDELALGHVLGGLPHEDASAFRSHLVGCQLCRRRVAELRSLDSEMAAAEREERAAERMRLQLESRESETPRDLDPIRPERPRWVSGAMVAVVALLVFGVSLWNAHLRTQNAELSRVAELQAETLGALGAGTMVPADTSRGVTGVVAVEGDRIAYSLAGVPTPSAGERLVVWLELPDGPAVVAVHTGSQIQDGRMASTVSRPDVDRILITIEPAAVPDAPTDPYLLEARLTGDG